MKFEYLIRISETLYGEYQLVKTVLAASEEEATELYKNYFIKCGGTEEKFNNLYWRIERK